jgi:hypothetical protein
VVQPPQVDPAPSVVRAFPGAEGGGALATGGRGGAVYKVTNLNDSGAGSLRDCVNASGARTCVFTVGGTLRLSSKLRISNPYLTIAGQTAPGGGVELTWANPGSENDDIVGIEAPAHDVVIRYLRIRPGLTQQYGSGIGNNSGIYNVIVDHVSFAWGTWDNVSLYPNDKPMHHLTFQWNLLAEPLLPTNGAVNFQVGAAASSIAGGCADVDIHHNLISSGDHRNPIHRIKSGRIVNNVVYNWRYYATKVTGYKDVIGNYYKPGPFSGGGLAGHEIEMWWHDDGNNWFDPSNHTSVYVAGNAGPGNGYNPASNNWTTLTAGAPAGDISDSLVVPADASWQRTATLDAPGAATRLADGTLITVDGATDIGSASGPLLPIVGASARVDCNGQWLANRDALDARYVNDFLTGGGASSPLNAAGAHPSLAAGTACADADGNGIPDAYEVPRCGAPGCLAPSAVQADGYTNLEHYLNGR